MDTVNIKSEALRLVEALPESATWDDLMHQVYVRQAIEAGLRASHEGRVVSQEEARAKLGLPLR